jgi:hypothetical protein
VRIFSARKTTMLLSSLTTLITTKQPPQNTSKTQNTPAKWPLHHVKLFRPTNSFPKANNSLSAVRIPLHDAATRQQFDPQEKVND